MKRRIFDELIEWKNSTNKKPLILLGARQIGKTYILEELGKLYSKYYYFNLNDDGYVRDIFEEKKNIDEIVDALEVHVGERIVPGESLVFIDEIQDSKRAIMMLKYFNEKYSNIDVVCAGSLLGIALNRSDTSFPVGKITRKYMYPLDFGEFLLATGNQFLKEKMESSFYAKKTFDKLLHEKLMRLYINYICTGGMPEAVKEYINNGMDALMLSDDIYDTLISDYLDDMGKYNSSTDVVKTRAIYKSIPEQLLGGSSKFKYSVVESGKKARDFGSALEWLLLSSVNIEVACLYNGVDPIVSYVDNKKFKVYLSDVGMLRVLSKVKTQKVLKNDNYSFKGAFTENFIAIHLNSNFRDLYYYKDKKIEVDFIININGEQIPVEVKSGVNSKSSSLDSYIERYNPSYAIRFSAKNFGYYNNVYSLPLYTVYLLKENMDIFDS